MAVTDAVTVGSPFLILIKAPVKGSGSRIVAGLQTVATTVLLSAMQPSLFVTRAQNDVVSVSTAVGNVVWVVAAAAGLLVSPRTPRYHVTVEPEVMPIVKVARPVASTAASAGCDVIRLQSLMLSNRMR